MVGVLVVWHWLEESHSGSGFACSGWNFSSCSVCCCVTNRRDMERKQHLLVQEQQLWQQYGRDGVQGQVGLARVAGAPAPQTMMPFGMAQFGGIRQPGGYYPAAYY